MASLKGPGKAQVFDAYSEPPGSHLRIAIVHARWNTAIISALVSGARKTLLASGVQDQNIIIQDVPGSYELPLAAQKIYAVSQHQASNIPATAASAVTDLLSSTSLTEPSKEAASSESRPASDSTPSNEGKPLRTPFDAIIAIGVLIKGETMHFEYIADATSHGLMRVQLDTGVPIIFGLLTVLTEEQGKSRAGLSEGTHNHGEDWGSAAVELGTKRRGWIEGKLL